MIVKSMARKAPTYHQLIAYIGRDVGAPARRGRGSPQENNERDAKDDGVVFARNLHYDGADATIATRRFLENFQHLPKRKNGNALYHEVIVLEPQPALNAGRIDEALHDLAERYCALRAPEQLAWGRVHRNTAHPHIHLMISANPAGSPYRSRLTKAAFAQIQKDLEGYARETWPELRNTPVYDREGERKTPRITCAEGEAVRRTGKPSQKQEFADRIAGHFRAATDAGALEVLLAADGLELYQRGRAWGAIDRESGKRHRLKTLGLDTEFGRLQRGEQTLEPSSQTEPAPSRTAEDRAAALVAAREAAVEREIAAPSPPPPVDPRVKALLEARPTLDDIAREQLEDFERDQDQNR